jgi:electron transfer flavoprotein alpha/beta subunit
MNILTCFKIVHDLEMLTPEDWSAGERRVELKFAKREWNCFDETAIETALRLRDAASVGVRHRLTALTVDGPEAEPFLKILLALQYDRSVRIEPGETGASSPAAAAKTISDFVKKDKQELILTGLQSGEGDSGQTPLLTAEMLGWPCITHVFRVEADSGRTVRVWNRVDGGILEQEVKLPCLLVMGNSEISYLRIPTLKDRMNHGRRPLEVLTPGGGVPDEGLTLEAFEQIDNSRGGIIIDGGSPEEKARTLYEDHIKERLLKIWNTA